MIFCNFGGVCTACIRKVPTKPRIISVMGGAVGGAAVGGATAAATDPLYDAMLCYVCDITYYNIMYDYTIL